jgi:hypothetical protein
MCGRVRTECVAAAVAYLTASVLVTSGRHGKWPLARAYCRYPLGLGLGFRVWGLRLLT